MKNAAYLFHAVFRNHWREKHGLVCGVYDYLQKYLYISFFMQSICAQNRKKRYYKLAKQHRSSEESHEQSVRTTYADVDVCQCALQSENKLPVLYSSGTEK